MKIIKLTLSSLLMMSLIFTNVSLAKAADSSVENLSQKDVLSKLYAALASNDEAIIASVINDLISNYPDFASVIVEQVGDTAPQYIGTAVTAATNTLPADSAQLATILSKTAAAAAAGGEAGETDLGGGDPEAELDTDSDLPDENREQTSSS